MKLKCAWEQEFVIGGYTDPPGSRIEFGALLVGYYEDGRLRYAGKVGTGYTVAMLRDLGAQLRALETPESPFVDARPVPPGTHWTRPELVAQIGFAEWTSDGRLRQPRFLGLRDDKRPAEVVRERPEYLGARCSAVVVDDLDVVAVRIEHEGAVVARVVHDALAGGAVVLVARVQRGAWKSRPLHPRPRRTPCGRARL